MTNPLHTLPFDPPVANALHTEYLSMPWRRRWQVCRKAVFREMALRVSGQGRLMHDTVPGGNWRVLIVYSWTTVGDAIMDLSARHLIPPGVRLDLCIAPHLAPLFAGDDAFGRVVTSLDHDDLDPDFIVLDCLTTALLFDKARRFPSVPFATLRGQLIGERFDRTAFADRRMRQLFGLPPGPVEPPRLRALHREAAAQGACPFRLAVAIGARCADRRYPHWPRVLTALVERWPAALPAAEFWLLGSDNGADEVARFAPSFLRDRCVVKVGAGCLGQTAEWLRGCDAFVGTDGGLMHLAMALDRPGLALFTHSDPAYVAPRAGAMRIFDRPGPAAAVDPVELAERLLKVLDTSMRRTPAAAGRCP